MSKTSRINFLDGAMGTMIQKRQLSWQKMPETLNLTHPKDIQAIHQAYVDAGSEILLANTFGACPLRCAPYGLQAEELIAAGIANAKEAARSRAKVALDLGPCGQLLEPAGSLSFLEAVENFAAMVKAGVQAGADLIFIETMSSLAEARAALLAAKENSDLPVFVSMTFEENGRTFTGDSIASAMLTLDALGADAIGFNCSLGPAQMADMVKTAARYTDKPLICKPNAGLPDPLTGAYDVNEEQFAAAMQACVDAGAVYIGGCCGTNPDYIAALQNLQPVQEERIHKAVPMACSAQQAVNLMEIHAIGERINPTGKKRLQQALLQGDLDYVIKLALEQQQDGAAILDVNVGYPGVDEVTMLPAVVKALQAICPLPLQLDSTNAAALEAGLRVYNGKAIINSFSLDPASYTTILPVARKYGANIIGLCLDENGLPHTAKQRLEMAQKCRQLLKDYDIPADRLLIDPLTLTVSAQQDQAKETLQACTLIKEELQVPVVLGVSNISFGLPNRLLITRTFLAQALYAGCNLPIVNCSQKPLMDTLLAARVLAGQDGECKAYIAACQNAPAVPANTSAHNENMSLFQAVILGLKQEAAQAARGMLAKMSEQDIIAQALIPALDQVGKDYEAQKAFLPQLLASAQAAQAVFEVLKDSMAAKGTAAQKGEPIILATVKGDVHDIGKNIVKTILENYGYTLIDLGKDVPVQRIVDAVLQHNCQLVGLSALMTTTLPAMEETIAALKALENPPYIMCGGAVVTPEFVKAAGADFYCRDANDDIAAARKVFGK